MPKVIVPTYKTGFARHASESRAPDLRRDLIAAWSPLLGPTGLVLRDWSRYQRHADLSGGMTEADAWVVDEVHALDFNGTTNFAEYGSKLVADYPFTLEAWVKGDVASGLHAIISFADVNDFTRYYHIALVDGKPTLTARNITPKTITSPDSIIDGNWHHIAGVFASNTYRELFVDGVSKGVDTASVIYSWKIDTTLIGLLRKASMTGWFDGKISSARVYSSALSGGRIGQLSSERYIMWELQLPAAGQAPGGKTEQMTATAAIGTATTGSLGVTMDMTATAACATTTSGSLTIGIPEQMSATAAIVATATGTLTIVSRAGFIRTSTEKAFGGYF